MFKYKINFALLLIALMAISACEEHEELLQPTKDGAFPVISDISSAFFNLNEVETANVGFSLNTEGVEVSSINIRKIYIDKEPNQDGDLQIVYTSEEVEHSSTSSFPTTFTASSVDAVSGLSKMDGGALTIEDLSLGDIIDFVFVLNTTDGRSLLSKIRFRGPLSCPSDIGGAYNAVTTGRSTDSCCPDETTVEQVVTLAPVAGQDGTYTISSFSGGLYFEWYDVYGIAGDTPAEITDVCNNIALLPFAEPFGSTTSGTGVRNKETGVITYTWANGFSDSGTVTLTPQ